MVGGIHYLNSGDWVETMSALTEDESGEWKVVYYSDIAGVAAEEKESENVLPLIPIAS